MTVRVGVCLRLGAGVWRWFWETVHGTFVHIVPGLVSVQFEPIKEESILVHSLDSQGGTPHLGPYIVMLLMVH